MDINSTSIIVEGLDCTGKSTIIKTLMSMISTLKYYHFEFPQGNRDIEKYGFQYGQFDMMFKFIEMTQGQSHFIFDRAHIGEYVWGPKYRNMFPSYMPTLEETYKDLPIVLVHVKCASNIIQQRFQERENETTPYLPYIDKYSKLFEIFCNRSPFKTITVDTTNLITIPDINGRIEHLIHQIKAI